MFTMDVGRCTQVVRDPNKIGERWSKRKSLQGVLFELFNIL